MRERRRLARSPVFDSGTLPHNGPTDVRCDEVHPQPSSRPPRQGRAREGEGERHRGHGRQRLPCPSASCGSEGDGQAREALIPSSLGPSPTALSKSDFIRSIPATTPARDVVIQARNVGLDLDVHYVYRIRAAAGSKAAPQAPALTSEGRDEPPARGGELATPSTSTLPGTSELNVSELSSDFEGDLALLEEADAAIRILYAELAMDPDLWSRCETALRELQSKRTELALQVGLAALRGRRAQRAARESGPSQTTPARSPHRIHCARTRTRRRRWHPRRRYPSRPPAPPAATTASE